MCHCGLVKIAPFSLFTSSSERTNICLHARILDAYGFVHRNINLVEKTNKMRSCSRIYYSNVS